MNDYTDEAAALIVGETYNCATVAEEIVIVAEALRDAREKAIREAAEWHAAKARIAAAGGMSASTMAFYDGWMQAHRESESHFLGVLALLARPSEKDV